MVVPKKLRDKWKLLKVGGDVAYIAGTLGVSISTVSRAMNGGICSDETLSAITEFYRAREERIKAAGKTAKAELNT